LLCAALFVLALALSAQTPEWEWVFSAGGVSYDLSESIAMDSSGNSYVTGFFEGTASFGATTLTSSGGKDIFISKQDSDGNFLWVMNAGGSLYDYGYGIAVDSSGNIYVTGVFTGTASFGGNTLSCTSPGFFDIFVCKLDPNGNFLWAKKAGGTGQDYGYSIAMDNAGNSYVTGNFRGTARFGATTLTSSGSEDIYVCKLDPNGNFLWAKKAGGASNDYGKSIDVDSTGNCYVTGYFYGTARFGATTLTSSGSEDIYVCKLDPNGNFLWAKKAGGMSDDQGFGIAVDSTGNSYVTGSFRGTATFGEITLISSGYLDIFVCTLDTNGNFVWAVQAGGVFSCGYDIAVDSAGNSYVTGKFRYTSSFGAMTLTSSGEYDIFACKLDADGDFRWAVQAGGSRNDYGYGIAVDSAGNCCVTGPFLDTASFGAHTLTSSGSYEIFVCKLGSGTPVEDESIPAISLLTLSASPNPFSASTAITVAGGKPEHFSGASRIDIYDIRGRKVRSLDLEGGSGNMSLPWDGRDERGQPCPNGIYLARLGLGGRRATLKLSLVK